jgi:broad specificity phosphatase PhoE
VLVLVRHGRTAHNASHRLLGRLDVPLDELGVRQAQALAQVPAIRGAGRVLSSPLERARQTASMLGPRVCVDDRWTEMDYGVYDGMPLADVPDEIWQRWRSDPGWAPDGGESLLAVGRRVRAACDELVDEARNGDVVVVSHVSPIKLAVAWAVGAPDDAVWRMFLDTAAVSRVAVGPTGPSLRSFNEVNDRPSA